MLLMIAMALMTGAAIFAVIWPLSRRASSGEPDESADVRFYRRQLADLERDVERKLISPADADAARAEAGRRLLRAGAAGREGVVATGEPALRRRRAAAALALSGVPLIALAVYGAIGAPDIAYRSSTTRQAVASSEDLSSAVRQVERHLAANPDDLRGWDVIAPVYLAAGRFGDAARAYAAARRLGGDTAERLAGQGEALVAEAGGVVSPESGEMFRRAVSMAPQLTGPHYYLALAAEQDGDKERARDEYQQITAGGPPDAPWLPAIRDRLSRLAGGSAGSDLPSAGERPDILGMVNRLDARLASTGGSEAEWARLVRSYVVLGRHDDAVERLARARTALSADDAARERLDHLAQDLGLEVKQARR